jgi:SAM-dependent methyltransferase
MSDEPVRDEMAHYIIRGGLAGRERLRLLSRVMQPTTEEFFDRVGVAPDARCLDVGCGGGDVTALLAGRASRGSVVGVDVDDAKLDLCREEAAAIGIANVSFRHEDITEPPPADERYDVIYARFLLTHLVDPAKAVVSLVARLAPGGALLVEDIDFGGHFCHPYSAAFWTYVTLYSDAARMRGADPDIAPRVPGLLVDAGLRDLGVRIHQPVGLEGDAKLVAPITLEAIGAAAVGEGLIGEDKFQQIVDDLYAFAQTDGTILSLPRMVQAWGRAR